jgi:hypothetical protein
MLQRCSVSFVYVMVVLRYMCSNTTKGSAMTKEWKDAMQKGRERMAVVADKLSRNEPLDDVERQAVALLLTAMQNTSYELPNEPAVWDMVVHFECNAPVADKI